MTRRPEFHLHRVEHADCDGIMQIVPISQVELDTMMPRRSMFRTGLTVAGALVALTACDNTKPTAPESTTTPPPIEIQPPQIEIQPHIEIPPRRTTEPQPDESPGGSLPCGSPVPSGSICTCNCVRSR